MRGIGMGIVAAGAMVALAGCGAAGITMRPRDEEGGSSAPVDDPPATAEPPTSTTPEPAASEPAIVDGHVRLESNWATEAGPSLDALATSPMGARLIEAYRGSGAPIEVDGGIGTPARYEYRTTTRGGEAPVVRPTRVAITPDALANAETGASLLGHELTHFVVHTPGTSLHDAVEGAAQVSKAARNVMDETVSYTVQRELVEVLRPRPTPDSFTYESHSSDLDGFERDGSPKFTRRSLVETFDAVAADPRYAAAFDIAPGEFDGERAAIVAALRGAAPALGEWVPPDHVTVE